jgi:hypothetical protein
MKKPKQNWVKIGEALYRPSDPVVQILTLLNRADEEHAKITSQLKRLVSGDVFSAEQVETRANLKAIATSVSKLADELAENTRQLEEYAAATSTFLRNWPPDFLHQKVDELCDVVKLLGTVSVAGLYEKCEELAAQVRQNTERLLTMIPDVFPAIDVECICQPAVTTEHSATAFATDPLCPVHGFIRRAR